VGKSEEAYLSTDADMSLCKSWATQGRVKTGKADF